MKILIYGTGGVGGYFGARLEQAGNEVVFIARGAHLKAMKQRGLTIISPKGNCTLLTVKAQEYEDNLAGFDLIIIAVKTWQLKEVARNISSILSEYTMVLPLLNGITNTDVLKKIIPHKHIIGGLCKIVSKITNPGEITHFSYEPTIVFGELNNIKTPRMLRLESVLKKANIKAVLAKNIDSQIWEKFLFICTISGIGALTRTTIGAMRAHPEIRDIMLETANEVLAIANAKNIILTENIIEKQFAIIDKQPYDTTSSMQRDMMAGKPSELYHRNGIIVALGWEFDIPTPVNSFIYYSLLLQEEKARKTLK